MTNHTPGPWTLERRVDCQCVMAGESHIVFLADHIEYNGEPCGCLASQDKSQREIDANARLISAAPDLLEALKDVLAEIDMYLRGDTYGRPWLKQARAAITRAEGGE